MTIGLGKRRALSHDLGHVGGSDITAELQVGELIAYHNGVFKVQTKFGRCLLC